LGRFTLSPAPKSFPNGDAVVALTDAATAPCATLEQADPEMRK